MTFRIGQMVELVDNEGMAAKVGATAIVKMIGTSFIDVVWKRDSKWNKQGDGGYYPKDFRPIFRKNQQLLFSFMER